VSDSPERDLEVFLAALPARKRKEFELGLTSLTEDELAEWYRCPIDPFDGLIQEYERLLQRIPAKWRAYRKRKKREAHWYANTLVPKGSAGRPRKDGLAQEAAELQQRDMNFPQISAELNKRYGKDTTTPAAIPKLIKRFLARTKSSA
jgi:hypothetical protein